MGMTGVIGIDPGLTSLGIARVDLDSRKVETAAIGTQAGIPIWERYRHTVLGIAKFIRPGDVVFMEDYAFAIQKGSLVQMAEIGALIKTVCYHKFGCWPFPVGITTLKKFMTGKGQGIKYEDIKLALYKSYRLEFATTDECIAFGLTQFGLCVLGFDPTPDKNLGGKWFGYESECAGKYRKKADARLQTFANTV